MTSEGPGYPLFCLAEGFKAAAEGEVKILARRGFLQGERVAGTADPG